MRTQLGSDGTKAIDAGANHQSEPSMMEETSYVPEDDDKGVEARGLKVLNQMHEEL